MRFVLGLYVLFGILLVFPFSTRAGSNRCADLFKPRAHLAPGFGDHAQIIDELANLHILQISKEKEAVKSWASSRFHERFAELSALIGEKNVRIRLREALARLSNREAVAPREHEQVTEEKRMMRRYDPIDLQEVQIFNPVEVPWGHIHPEGDIAVQEIGQSAKLVRFIDSAKRVHSTPWKSQWPKDIWNIQWHKRGSRRVATGLTRNPEQIFVLDEKSGRSWILPTQGKSMPRTGSLAYSIFDISADGRFAVSVDENQNVHRLDLRTGKLNIHSGGRPSNRIVGILAQKKGGVELWTENQTVITLDRDLKLIRERSMQELYGFQLPPFGVMASPDKKQILFVSDRKTVLFDLLSRKQSEIAVGGDVRFVKWFENQVWLQFLGSKNAARMSRDLSSVESETEIRPWTAISSDRFVAQTESPRNFLKVFDLETGKSTEYPLQTDSVKYWPTAFLVAVSADGERFALYPMGNNKGQEVYIFNPFGELVGTVPFTDAKRFISVRFTPDGNGLSAIRNAAGDPQAEVSFWHIQERGE